MITLHKAGERGHAQHGWIDSYHTFSFADYYDPRHMGFRSLRVLNENWLKGGRGFDAHPHRDFEILTYVVRGELAHKDSQGHTTLLSKGSLQRISAGLGVEYSQYNNSSTDSVHFIQIWLQPNHAGLSPSFAQASFSNTPPCALFLACSPEGRASSISLNQDVDVFIGRLEARANMKHPLRSLGCAWVQLIEGELSIETHRLKPGDGVSIQGERDIPLESEHGAHLLLFDLC
jgi:redox-sensitive bicupin YhaK (pirin superfamily)